MVCVGIMYENVPVFKNTNWCNLFSNVSETIDMSVCMWLCVCVCVRENAKANVGKC